MVFNVYSPVEAIAYIEEGLKKSGNAIKKAEEIMDLLYTAGLLANDMVKRDVLSLITDGIAGKLVRESVQPLEFNESVSTIASEFEDYENGETYDLQDEWEDFVFSVKEDAVIFSGRAYVGDVKGSYSDKRGLEMIMMIDSSDFADWFKDNPVKITYQVKLIKPENVIGDIHNTLAAINSDNIRNWESVKDVSKFLRDNGLKTTSKILEPED